MACSSATLEAAVRVLLRGVGEDPEREGLLDTPKVGTGSLREFTLLELNWGCGVQFVL